jgi:hypothetical protein
MSFLGELNRSESIRLFLTLDAAPTGTPTVTIEKNGGSIQVADDMTQGLSNLEWYYDYTTGGSATVGTYQVRYTAVIDAVTRYAFDHYNVSINSIDDTKDAVDALGGGVGAYEATINVKDQVPINIADAIVTIHNSNNDDDPIIARDTTNASGNVVLNIDGTVYVRIKKTGFNFTAESINVTASGTYNVTGTSVTIQNPSDPDVCRLFIFPVTIGNTDITDLKIYIKSQEAFAKTDGGLFISNKTLEFTYDPTTAPDSYYFDAIRGALVHIQSDFLGIDKEDLTVPDEATKDLDELIL